LDPKNKFLKTGICNLGRGVRGLLSPIGIVGGIKANTSEQPHAAYSSRLTFDVTIPVVDGSLMSIPIKDLALIIFVLITTNDWNGDGILITEVASALLEGLPNWILPDVKVYATVTKEGAPGRSAFMMLFVLPMEQELFPEY